MENKIDLRPCIGVVVGTEDDPIPQTVEWDQDEIWCNGHRIGYVSTHEGAVCRIHRVLTASTKAHIAAEVQRLRAEQGKPPIAEHVSSLVGPEAIRGALASHKKGKKPR